MEYNRILWACRRGMLELDLFLLPYAKTRFQSLTDDERSCFEQFLAESDQDISRWLLGQASPHGQYLNLIEEIKTVARQSQTD